MIPPDRWPRPVPTPRPSLCVCSMQDDCPVHAHRADRSGRAAFVCALLFALVALLGLLCSQAHAQVVLGGPVDAGSDVPLYALLDAGAPAPFAGIELNEAAQRHLLAKCEAAAGAPVQAVADDSTGDTVLHLAIGIVSAGVAVYVHQRLTH